MFNNSMVLYGVFVFLYCWIKNRTRYSEYMIRCEIEAYEDHKHFTEEAIKKMHHSHNGKVFN